MNQNTSAQYFADIDAKRQEIFARTYSFRVRVCGRLIELCFPQEDMCRAARRSLHGFITGDQARPDAEFFYWYDACENYFPQSYKAPSLPREQGEPGQGFPRLIAGDNERRRFYFVRPRTEGDDYSIHGRSLVCLFSRWASASDMLMLHAACVGVDGKGVLVVGRSGSGKTTFSLSCLFDGMDFISDDYTLISGSGPIMAKPLYSMVGVTPEMCRRFPRLEQLSVLPPKYLSNGKYQYVMPAGRLASGLEIKAIILPVVKGEEQVSIRASAPGKAMTHLLHSSAMQMYRERDTGLIRQMAQRLAGLPVYEMSQSIIFEKNPAALREFIRNNF